MVAVTRDRYVNKGPNRPIFGERDRLAMVKALRCVDQVLLVRDSFEALKRVKPDILVKGIEYREKLIERDYCLHHGIRMEFISPKPEIRTSLLRKR